MAHNVSLGHEEENVNVNNAAEYEHVHSLCDFLNMLDMQSINQEQHCGWCRV